MALHVAALLVFFLDRACRGERGLYVPSSMADRRKGTNLRLGTLDDSKNAKMALHESHGGQRVQNECLALGFESEKALGSGDNTRLLVIVAKLDDGWVIEEVRDC